MKLSIFSLAAIASAGPLASRPGSSLRYEHPGRVFSTSHSQGCCVQGVVHDEEPRGYTKEYDGETLYVTSPLHRYGGHHGEDASSAAILYLTDIFGLGIPNNQLLADSLASAGYLVVVPDLFRGDPVPEDGLDEDSDFDFAAWQAAHPQSEIDTIINSAIATMRSEFDVQKLGAVGYCFGGPYVARLLAPSGSIGDGLVSAGFTAHPSGVEAEQWEAVAKPISVAYGALDESNPMDARHEAEGAFVGGNKTFEIALYAEAEHGFAVRTNLSVKALAFAQESAYFQAVRWLDAWVKDVPVVEN